MVNPRSRGQDLATSAPSLRRARLVGMSRSEELRLRWSAVDLWEIMTGGRIRRCGDYYLAFYYGFAHDAEGLSARRYDDIHDAIASVRYVLIPGLLGQMCRSPYNGPLGDANVWDIAVECFVGREESQENLEISINLLGRLLSACDAARDFPRAAVPLMDYIVELTREVFRSSVEILAYGSLRDVLSAGPLSAPLRQSIKDGDSDFPYAELATLVSEGRFDDSFARHLELAREYWPKKCVPQGQWCLEGWDYEARHQLP